MPAQDETSITVSYYISSVTFDNEGDYVCNADNEDFVSSDQFTVTVFG